jgi:dihydrofolate reductase
MPKYVASTTLGKPEWNASVLPSDVVDGVRKLKESDGGDLLVYGSPKLVETLMKHDLVDRYNLLVYPIVLGAGKRLFESDVAANLSLVESKAHSTGAAQLIYEPAR